MLLWYIVYCGLVIIPFWQLLPRYGFPSALAFLAVIPLAAIALLWLLAFGDTMRPGGGGRAGRGPRFHGNGRS